VRAQRYDDRARILLQRLFRENRSAAADKAAVTAATVASRRYKTNGEDGRWIILTLRGNMWFSELTRMHQRKEAKNVALHTGAATVAAAIKAAADSAAVLCNDTL